MSNNKQRVAVKSFSGFKAKDMKDYLKPPIPKKPDEIILHVGTYDVKDNSKSAEVIATGILNLGNQIKDRLPQTNVSISNIIVRKGKAIVQNKIKNVNDILKRVGDQNNWTYMDNINVNHASLNRGSLHLNRNGSATLSRNFSNYFNCSC